MATSKHGKTSRTPLDKLNALFFKRKIQEIAEKNK